MLRHVSPASQKALTGAEHISNLKTKLECQPVQIIVNFNLEMKQRKQVVTWSQTHPSELKKKTVSAEEFRLK